VLVYEHKRATVASTGEEVPRMALRV